MKLLLSAYACEPDRGSEPEVGLRAMLVAASVHDVWVLTRRNNIPALRTFLRDDPRHARIRLVGVDLGPRWRALKRRGQGGLHLYYDAWQRRAGAEAQTLHQQINFDVVHHVTFAADWTRVGVATVDAPLLWGPVGGGVRSPRSLLPALGIRGAIFDAGRLVAAETARALPQRRADRSRAVLALAQNAETAQRLKPLPSVVLPNVVAIDVTMPAAGRPRTADIAVVGRLLPLKAGTLAVRALTHVRHAGARLVFYGAGPDQFRIAALAQRLGVGHRVAFAGEVPRAEVLQRVAEAGVLLHTCIHEEAGMAVAEALAMGTPVVCLAHGGPAEVVRWWPGQPATAVEVGPLDPTAAALGHAVDHWLDDPPEIPTAITRPSRAFDEVLLDTYERVAQLPVR